MGVQNPRPAAGSKPPLSGVPKPNRLIPGGVQNEVASGYWSAINAGRCMWVCEYCGRQTRVDISTCPGCGAPPVVQAEPLEPYPVQVCSRCGYHFRASEKCLRCGAVRRTTPSPRRSEVVEVVEYLGAFGPAFWKVVGLVALLWLAAFCVGLAYFPRGSETLVPGLVEPPPAQQVLVEKVEVER